MAKYLDQNGLLYFWQQVKPKIDAKVDAVEGKGLSTNDLTDELLAKLTGIAEGAQVNVLESVKVNGVAQNITDKGVDIAVPTKTSDLTNDSGFITTADIPEGAAASTTVPLMDGTAAVGTELAFARGDHVHPTDTSRAAAADLTAEVARAKAAEEANAGKIAAIEADYLKQADKYDDTALAARVKTIEDDYLKAEDKYDDTALAARVKAVEDDYLKGADKTELQGNIDTVSGKVDTLIGSDANKSVRTIANEELAAQLIADGAKESLDTLEEIAAWIQSHPGDASAMNAAIVALQNQLKGIDAGEGTVKKYVDDAISALSIGDYAKAADLTALAGRMTTAEGKITTLEGQAHTHDNKTVLDGITAEKVAAWDAAEGNAKTYADGLNTAMAGRVSTLEGLVDTNNQTVSAYVKAAIEENVVTVSNSEIDEILAI